MSDTEEPAIGEWIGHNGGECPVHPKTIVEVAWFSVGNEPNVETIEARERLTWGNDGFGVPPFAYRIIKEYKEPREYWIELIEDGYIINTYNNPEDKLLEWSTLIHVKEVIHD